MSLSSPTSACSSSRCYSSGLSLPIGFRSNPSMWDWFVTRKDTVLLLGSLSWLAPPLPVTASRESSSSLDDEASRKPWQAFRPAGVIIFSDILTPLPAFGVPFDIEEFVGDSLKILRREVGEHAAARSSLIQIFDSWGGQLTPEMWERWSKPYIEEIIHAVKKKMSRYADSFLHQWKCLPVLSASCFNEEIERVVKCAGPKGHILNLGHGVLVGTPEEAVAHFFETARNLDYQHFSKIMFLQKKLNLNWLPEKC
ncbi:unnamed protein product [Arabidopsis arenosa]|uniref:Uroporphyrinogen decarboxylase (URO-D) domain-containing protein n=1 Tax=Arabidopsis arenosa TaxID=38785 RepID=A0A8S2A0X5_ARAAE|nr:unnamed protein product [Arabidopsis arenosa]